MVHILQIYVTATFTGITIEHIEFHTSIIPCNEQVMQQITLPLYSMPTDAYNCFACTWTAATEHEQILPEKMFKNNMFNYASTKCVNKCSISWQQLRKRRYLLVFIQMWECCNSIIIKKYWRLWRILKNRPMQEGIALELLWVFII